MATYPREWCPPAIRLTMGALKTHSESSSAAAAAAAAAAIIGTGCLSIVFFASRLSFALLLRRVLRRVLCSKFLFEGLLEGACKGFQ